MFDYYLKFTSQKQADIFLAQYISDVDNVVIDRIGTLYDQINTGKFDENNSPVYEYKPKNGYHVNVRSRYEIDCKQEIEVLTPSRVFA